MKRIWIISKMIALSLLLVVSLCVLYSPDYSYGFTIDNGGPNYSCCPGNSIRIDIVPDNKQVEQTFNFEIEGDATLNTILLTRITSGSGSDKIYTKYVYTIRIQEEGIWDIRVTGTVDTNEVTITVDNNHQYASDFSIDQEPTCTEQGTKSRHCSKCEAVTDITTIEALGHDYIHHDKVEATCTEDGNEAYDTCSRCDYTTYEKISKTGHDLGEWVTIKEPTEKEDGLKRSDCSRCDYYEEEVIDALTLVQRGEAGEDITWMLFEDGTLSLEGSGKTFDYPDGKMPPWNEYSNTIKTITIGSGITYIGLGILRDYQNVESISFSDGLERIREIENLPKLSNLTFPSGLLQIDNIIDCENVETVSFPEGLLAVTVIQNLPKVKELVFPSGIKSIMKIINCSSLKELTIPSTVGTLNQCEGCVRLEKVSIPFNNNCRKKLNVINVSEDTPQAQKYDYWDYYSNSNRTPYHFANKVYLPPNLTEITINSGNIDDFAFAASPSKVKITLLEGVTGLNDYSFYKSGIESLVLPNSVTQIGAHAFEDCKSLKTINITENITSIGEYAFSGCSSLEYVSIPRGVETVGEKAFLGCSNIKYVEFSDVESFLSFDKTTASLPLRSILINDEELTDLVIPETVTSVPSGCLYHCSSIKSVTLPKTVTKIGNNTFGRFITSGIEYVRFEGDPPPSLTDAFCSNNSNEAYCNTIYYPCDNELWTETERLSWSTTAEWKPWHENIELVNTVAPTCTEGGYSEYKCSDCGEIIKKDIDPAGHSYEKIKTVKPTCTEKGYSEYKCSDCGEIITDNTVAQLGHEYQHIMTAGGYLTNGTEYDLCSRCGNVTNMETIAGYSTSYVKSFKVSKGKKAFTAKWKKQSKANQKKFNGYQLRYSTKPNMVGAKTVWLSKTSKSKKIKGLGKKARYYVQIRSYVKTSAGTFYSRWSTKSVITK